MNKSVLLSILGAALLPAIKDRSGSTSVMNNIVRSVGSRDGLITFKVQVEYCAPTDYENYKVYATLERAVREVAGDYNNLVEQMNEIGFSHWPDEFGGYDEIEHLEEQYLDAFAEELPDVYVSDDEFYPRASLPISKIEINRRYGLSEEFDMRRDVLEGIKEAADLAGFEYPKDAGIEHFMMEVSHEHGFDPYEINYQEMEDKAGENHLEFKISFDPNKSPKILSFDYPVFEKLINDILNISLARLHEWYGITTEGYESGECLMGGVQKVVVQSDIPKDAFPIDKNMRTNIRRF